MCDAIVRTLYRQFISHKNLLEVGFSRGDRTDIAQRLSVVSSGSCFLPSYSLWLLLVLTVIFRPTALPVLAVPALVWILSPLIAYSD
jgi:hypothetical protein